MKENVLRQIRDNPSKSTRQIALELEIPQSAVMSVFKGDELKCFRIHCAQKDTILGCLGNPYRYFDYLHRPDDFLQYAMTFVNLTTVINSSIIVSVSD
ncbi:hypothetical protein JTB14_019053 [Gonioctena quinquepunctata]|nr:hypothetical protein JTB14_019053 [Gonioctena quinquepunctata]